MTDQWQQAPRRIRRGFIWVTGAVTATLVLGTGAGSIAVERHRADLDQALTAQVRTDRAHVAEQRAAAEDQARSDRLAAEREAAALSAALAPRLEEAQAAVDAAQDLIDESSARLAGSEARAELIDLVHTASLAALSGDTATFLETRDPLVTLTATVRAELDAWEPPAPGEVQKVPPMRALNSQFAEAFPEAIAESRAIEAAVREDELAEPGPWVDGSALPVGPCLSHDGDSAEHAQALLDDGCTVWHTWGPAPWLAANQDPYGYLWMTLETDDTFTLEGHTYQVEVALVEPTSIGDVDTPQHIYGDLTLQTSFGSYDNLFIHAVLVR